MSVQALLRADGLRRIYAGRAASIGQMLRGGAPVLHAVDGVSLAVGPAEALALVGESGSGKTTTGLMIALLEKPTAGTVWFEGRDVTNLRGAALKAYRRRVQMIFQNPFEALDPRLDVLASVTEPLRLHGLGTPAERRERALAGLEAVELRPSRAFAARFPSDLSGGQLQRVSIARALVLSPSLVVADEPASMLDASVRAGVMAVMAELGERLAMATVTITHDFAMARAMAGRIAVMYAGKIVEQGPADAVLRAAAHPYTQLLLSAVARVRPGVHRQRVSIMAEPEIATPLPACRFAPRCPRATALCRDETPPLITIAGDHLALCHHARSSG